MRSNVFRSDSFERVLWDRDFIDRKDARKELEFSNLRLNIEGWAAAVAAVAVAGTAAYSSYSSSSAQKDALEYQANNTPQLHSYQPVLAQYDPTAGVSQYLQAQGQYGYQTAKAADVENKYYQDSLNRLAPVTNSLMVAGNNNARLLRGELPKDVASNVARNAAQANLTNGTGYDSGQGRNYTARDFGKTSLDLQQQGLSNLNLIENLAARLNPVSGAQLIGDPSQYATRNDNYVFRNQQVQNDAAKDAAGVANQNSLSQYQAAQAGIAASNINPYAGAIASGVGSAASLYLNYGAGGGGLGGYSGTPQQQVSSSGYYNPTQNANLYNNAGKYTGPNYYGWGG